MPTKRRVALSHTMISPRLKAWCQRWFMLWLAVIMCLLPVLFESSAYAQDEVNVEDQAVQAAGGSTVYIPQVHGNAVSRSLSGSGLVRQGMFYDAPADGTSPRTVAQRASVVVFTRGKIRYLNELRQQGFRGLALQYVLSNEVIGPGPYANSSAACDRAFTPTNNNVANQLGDFCTYIHPNESWFLHNGKGERLYSRTGRGVAYHMNPASAGWRAFARARILRDLVGDATQARIGFDGIYLDNLAVGTYKLRHQLSNSDGVVREYPTNESYRAAAIGYLDSVVAPLRAGGPIWANLIDDFENTAAEYQAYVDRLDGYLNEGWAVGYVGRTGPSPARWHEMLTIAERAQRQGKGVFAVVQGHRTDHARQRFGLASYLLITDLQRAVFRYANAEAYHEWWQYDNYQVALGAPQGARYQVGSTWRRDFACGYVEVDPAARTANIVQTCD